MSVTLRFCGAARTVTGSCFLFETSSGRFLVDCGLFQGQKTLKALNYGPFPFEARDIRAVLLTHAHIDHSGLIPKLVREGFKGTIFATRGTIDLCSVMLPDAGSIQESEVASLNRRNLARGRAQVEAIYTQNDALRSLEVFREVEYLAWCQPVSDVRARFWNAGHLLGSASIELEFSAANDQSLPLRVLVSGDIGSANRLLQPKPEAPSDLDYVISESTYGGVDRPSTTLEDRRKRLADEVRSAVRRHGPLIIPAFAVERTQELIVDLVHLMDSGEVPSAPMFLDSPLAIRATEIFRQSAAKFADADVARNLSSKHLLFTETVDESKAIAKLSGFHIIIAGSGMCEAGRIRHHLKRWLWNRNATVLFTGFQAQGTLGRFLVEGARAVRIQGEEIRVAAQIRKMDEYSGHADGPELQEWIAGRAPVKRGIFLVHGEEMAMDTLSKQIAGMMINCETVVCPTLDSTYELGGRRAILLSAKRKERLTPDAVVNLDWHNDMSKLVLDINDRIDAAADERSKQTIIRRLRRALDDV